MPKTEIDYSNTIIYKITCRDPSITDVYVGHTTNFVQRKHSHKQSCINEKSANSQCKLYKIIRENGGWANWTMDIINFFNCNNHYEARLKEQEYYISLNATMNSVEPLPTPIPKKITKIETVKQTFWCEICKIKFQNEQLMNNHNQTKKHLKRQNAIKIQMVTENHPIIPHFSCALCEYTCRKQSDFTKHCLTRKHLERVQLDSNIPLHFLCKKCNYTTANKKDYRKHLSTLKHTTNLAGLNKIPKIPIHYSCKICDYTTANKKDYKEHLFTPNHLHDDVALNPHVKIPIMFKCECGKEYKYRQGLFTHRKKCTYQHNPSPLENDNKLSSLMIQILQQNQAIIMENKEMRELFKESILK